jgi:UTP-glucose-1-phosphate uridylyltransferase
MAAGAAVCQVPLAGQRFDCGSLQGYLDAVRYVADHELYHEFHP